MLVVIVKMVKMMKCHVKVQETVSDEARGDQWVVHSIERAQHT